ncbi:MAG: class I SAM-dependent RNA methyltransferase [Kiritimatiellae bacterium]|nr:class I SAM-dependent RNA methyltransferase [Kiritimatiellia bacterium]
MATSPSIELDITDLAYGGDGVGRIDGRACFVPFALPGEHVRARLTQETTRYARADDVEVLASSPERAAPTCPHFRACGGCRYQHLDYAAQVRWKQKQVAEILARIGGFRALPLDPMAPSPRSYGYRNKITLHGPGHPAFLALDNKRTIPIARCPLASGPINAILQEHLRRTLAKDEDLVIRSNQAGEVRWFTERDGRRAASDGKPDTMSEKVLDQSYDYPLNSFFQVNPEILKQILIAAGGRIETFGCSTLVDAYCGVGVFVLALTRSGQRGIGIEVDAAAVAVARANAARQAAGHVTFLQGRAEERLDRALRGLPADKTGLILDPPRAGCSAPVLQAVTRHRPRHLLYLSCVPPIMARDLKQLAKSGYRLVRVQPFDMFPQTAHIECLAELDLM